MYEYMYMPKAFIEIRFALGNSMHICMKILVHPTIVG